MASFSKLPELHIANALRLAKEDLEAARALIAVENRFGAYHLQQCGEKILIALLTSEDVHVDRKDAHRLDVLREKLPDANPFKARFRPLAVLTVFATTYRYPKDGGRIPPMPDRAQTTIWADDLEHLLSDAARHFEVDLEASDRDPAARRHPPRTGG